MTICVSVALAAAAAWVPWRGSRAEAAEPDWLDAALAAAPSIDVSAAATPERTSPVHLASYDRAESERIDGLLARARDAEGAFGAVERAYDEEVAPIARVLERYGGEPVLARRVAVALVREAHRAELEPRVLLAVLLVENPMLRQSARSSVGAVGVMQVMPLHRGHWRKCGNDLEELETNVCYGAQIFAHYLRRAHGDVDTALLRYNGCVTGANTPNCDRYPYHVYARAGRASMLAWLTRDGAGVASGAAAP